MCLNIRTDVSQLEKIDTDTFRVWKVLAVSNGKFYSPYRLAMHEREFTWKTGNMVADADCYPSINSRPSGRVTVTEGALHFFVKESDARALCIDLSAEYGTAHVVVPVVIDLYDIVAVGTDDDNKPSVAATRCCVPSLPTLPSPLV